jgi:ribosomal protein L14E/L6E/L27E
VKRPVVVAGESHGRLVVIVTNANDPVMLTTR